MQLKFKLREKEKCKKIIKKNPGEYCKNCTPYIFTGVQFVKQKCKTKGNMNITKKSCRYNKRYPINSLFIPSRLFKKVLLRGGGPDLVGIHILAELLSLSQRTGNIDSDFELRDCFTYFQKVFCIRRPALQRASFRLEAASLVSRTFYTAIIEDKSSKELCLKPNMVNINALSNDEEACL